MMKFARPDKFQIASIVALLVAAGGYGFWSWSSDNHLSTIRSWPQTAAAHGWRMTLDAPSVRGFPARADVALSGVAVEPASPRPAWPFRLEAESVETQSLIYRPDFLGLRAPNGLAIETPTGDVALRGLIEASLVNGPTDDAGVRPVERLSVSGARLGVEVRRGEDQRAGSADLAELHLRPAPGGDPEKRRLFLRLDGLTFEGAAAASVKALRLDALARFAAPPDNDAGLALDLASLDLGQRAAPGLVIDFGDGKLLLSGSLSRESGSWRGLLGFETDEGPAVLGHLSALALITEEEKASVTARLTQTGRIAGVLSIRDGAVSIEDIQPESIPIALPRQPSMEQFWRLN